MRRTKPMSPIKRAREVRELRELTQSLLRGSADKEQPSHVAAYFASLAELPRTDNPIASTPSALERIAAVLERWDRDGLPSRRQD